MLGKVELEDSEKIQHLLEAMKSPADASLVEKVSEKGSYEETVEALQLKYDQPRKLYRYHVQAVNGLPAVKNNEESCERIIQDVTSHLSSLIEIGDDKLTTFIAAMQVNLMDEYTGLTSQPTLSNRQTWTLW